MVDAGGWRLILPPTDRDEPPYDQQPVDVMMANGFIVEAIYQREALHEADAAHGERPARGWLRAGNLTELPYPAIRWRPRRGGGGR